MYVYVHVFTYMCSHPCVTWWGNDVQTHRGKIELLCGPRACSQDVKNPDSLLFFGTTIIDDRSRVEKVRKRTYHLLTDYYCCAAC